MEDVSTGPLTKGVLVPFAELRRSRERVCATWRARPRAALLGLSAALAACTLSDDFTPVRVDQLSNLAGDAGVAPLGCSGGAACCADVSCSAGQECLEGACDAGTLVLASPDAGACRGSECPLPEELLPPAPTCDDGLAGPDETDSDCGGVCGSTCRVDQRCAGTEDCQSGLVCSPESSRCALGTCSDGLRSGVEVLTDCGGGSCPGCPDGTACSAPADCQSGVCGANGTCAAASCTDAVKNGAETDVDCAGSCADCPTGRACNEPADCSNGVCRAAGCAPGVANCCQAPTCNDGVRNGGESDVDCAGRCRDCAPGRACAAANDCQTGVCGAGGCAEGVLRCCQAPSCSDGVENGDESDIDCGTGCGLCPLAAQCGNDAECQSGFCQTGRCADRGTCNDGVRNGTESAIDCGGSACPRCADRLTCALDSDCINNNCFNDVCISCGSGVQDGTETGIDCGGGDPFCRRCNPGERCVIGSDCVSGQCFGGFC